MHICTYLVNVESVAIILTEDVSGFKSTVWVISYACFSREKKLGNRVKSQDYLVFRPTVNF